MSTLRRNVGWLFVAQLATWLVSIIVLILAPSKLEAVGYGQISLATAFIGFFTLIASLGTSQYITRAVAHDHSAVGPLVLASVRLKWVVGPIACVAAVGVAAILGYSSDTILLIAIGCLGMMAMLLNEIFVAGLNGMEIMARPALWQTAQVYVGTLAGIAVLLTTQSVTAYFTVFVAASFIPLVANYSALRPHLQTASAAPRMRWRPIIVGGAPLLALSLFNLVYGTVDVPIIESVSGSEVVGWYAVATKWVGMTIFITTIVTTAFYPQMASTFRRSVQEFADLTNRGIKLVLVVTIPAGIGMIAISQSLLTLIYDDQYANSVVLMQILSVAIPLTAFDSVLATALVASNRQNRYVWIAGLAALFNPPLAYLAVSVAQDRYGNGAIGASILSVATELFILCCAVPLQSKGVLDARTLRFIGRCLVAATAMAIALYLVGSQFIIVKILVGIATYGVASLALGTLNLSELRGGLSRLRAARPSAAASIDPEGSDDMSDRSADS